MTENLLYDALSKAQFEIKHAILDMTNPHFKSKYASLTSVQDAYKSALAKHGFSVIQLISSEGDLYFIETILAHKCGDSIKNKFKLLIDKPTMQGLGSAITYGRRYGVSALLGIVDTEDDDGNAAEPKQKPKSKPHNTDLENESMKVGKYTGKTLREVLEADSASNFVLAKWVHQEISAGNKQMHPCYVNYLTYAQNEGFK